MNKHTTILMLQKEMEKQNLTAVEITAFYLNRIQKIDKDYHAVFMVNPDALLEAKRLDEERSKGHVRSHMHGIPLLLKDNINTADKQTTTAGTTILKNHYAKRDATLVKQLKKQGAVILGKTNLTELACFKTFTGVNGYSSLGGQVIFPWDRNEDPSGSSTGSAVAVSLRLAPLAIGTETGGSIMSPAMRNGVIGLKPTIGLVSRTGIIPISKTLDTAGPMANHVSDLAVLLSGMRSNDAKDEVTMVKEDTYIDYTTFLNTHHVKRIGVIDKSVYPIPKDRREAFEKTCHHLEQLGYTLVHLEVPEVKNIYQIMLYEFKHELNQYLKQEGLSITLKDIIKHNETHPNENLKYGQDVLIEAENKTSGLMHEKPYIEAINEREDSTRKMNQMFKDQALDMLYVAGYTSNGPACGFPTLTLPVAFDEKGLPIGTYFLAPYWKEGYLIEVAHRLQQHLKINVDPQSQSR